MSDFKVKLMNLRSTMKNESIIIMIDTSKVENSVKVSGVVATFSFTPDVTAKVLDRYKFSMKGNIAILECNPFEFYTWIRFQLYKVEVGKEDIDRLIKLVGFVGKNETNCFIKDKTFVIQPNDYYAVQNIMPSEIFNGWFGGRLEDDINFYIIDKLNPCEFYGKIRYTNETKSIILEYSEKI